MRKFLQKKSKQGITLVESVIAVVLLGFAATGILTMLTVSGTKIFQLGSNSAAYADATQVLDMAISTISNSPSSGNGSEIFVEATGDLKDNYLKDMLKDILKNNGNEDLRFEKLTITSRKDLYEDAGATQSSLDIRGWYLTVTYRGATVTGFASYTEGAFDKP